MCIRDSPITVGLAVVMALLGGPLFSLFTSDPRILALGRQILWVEVLLEVGRSVNIVMVRDVYKRQCLHGPRRTCQASGGRYTRVLRTPQNLSDEALGEALASYVRLFDTCLKTFFDDLSDADSAVRAVQRAYTCLLYTSRCV